MKTNKTIQIYTAHILMFLGWEQDLKILEKNIEKETDLCHLRFHYNWDDINYVLKEILDKGHRFYLEVNEEHTKFTFTNMAIKTQSHKYGGGDIVFEKEYKGYLKKCYFQCLAEFCEKYNSGLI